MKTLLLYFDPFLDCVCQVFWSTCRWCWFSVGFWFCIYVLVLASPTFWSTSASALCSAPSPCPLWRASPSPSTPVSVSWPPAGHLGNINTHSARYLWLSCILDNVRCHLFPACPVLYDVSVLANPLTWILLLTLIISVVTQVSSSSHPDTVMM